MKTKLYIILSLLGMYLSSCGNAEEKEAKTAVRKYLEAYRIYDYKEREWSELDSIFPAQYLSKQYEQAIRYLDSDITRHEITLLGLNAKRDKDRISIIRDSISKIEDKKQEVQNRYDTMMSERKNRNKSISLILTYKSPSGLEFTNKYVFVFKENSLNISHVLDEYGDLVRL